MQFRSGKKSVASVSKTGIIRAKKAGTEKITARSDGNIREQTEKKDGLDEGAGGEAPKSICNRQAGKYGSTNGYTISG